MKDTEVDKSGDKVDLSFITWSHNITPKNEIANEIYRLKHSVDELKSTLCGGLGFISVIIVFYVVLRLTGLI